MTYFMRRMRKSVTRTWAFLHFLNSDSSGEFSRNLETILMSVGFLQARLQCRIDTVHRIYIVAFCNIVSVEGVDTLNVNIHSNSFLGTLR